MVRDAVLVTGISGTSAGAGEAPAQTDRVIGVDGGRSPGPQDLEVHNLDIRKRKGRTCSGAATSRP